MAWSNRRRTASGNNTNAEPFRYVRYVIAILSIANLIALFVFNYGLPDPQVKSPTVSMEYRSSENNSGDMQSGSITTEQPDEETDEVDNNSERTPEAE